MRNAPAWIISMVTAPFAVLVFAVSAVWFVIFTMAQLTFLLGEAIIDMVRD